MKRQQEINCKNRKGREVINEILFLKRVVGQEEFVLLNVENATEEKIRRALVEKGIRNPYVKKETMDIYTIGIY